MHAVIRTHCDGCVLSCSVVSSSLQSFGPQPTRLLCPWTFPGKNIGVGCHFLLLRIFLTQGSNLHLLCLLHCRQILDLLSLRKRSFCIYTQEKELNSPQTTYIHIRVGMHVYVCMYIWSGGYLHTHSVGLPWFPSQMV